LNTIEEPGELIKTKVIELVDNVNDYERLGWLSSYDAVEQASRRMKHGEIKPMMDWTKTEGGVPPWQIKRVFGRVPVPFFALGSIIILLFASGRGLSMEWVVIIFLLVLISLLALGFWMAEYKWDKVGICLICGQKVGNRFKKSIEVYNHKGQRSRIAQSGYCDLHAWTVNRATHWSIIEQQVWNGIVSNPIRTPNLLRRIGYQFFWWTGYREQFTDPRPIAHGVIYERKDRSRPRDQMNENIIDSTVSSLFTAIDNLQRLKKMRRKI